MPLTVKEVAARSRLSKSLVYELCRTGRLKHMRVGTKGKGKILIDPDDLDELMLACRVAVPPDDEGGEQLTFLG